MISPSWSALNQQNLEIESVAPAIEFAICCFVLRGYKKACSYWQCMCSFTELLLSIGSYRNSSSSSSCFSVHSGSIARHSLSPLSPTVLISRSFRSLYCPHNFYQSSSLYVPYIDHACSFRIAVNFLLSPFSFSRLIIRASARSYHFQLLELAAEITSLSCLI